MSYPKGYQGPGDGPPGGSNGYAAIGHFHANYNPYAPPAAYNMNQANLSRAKWHTLGPTSSYEEDGDDSEFIKERMKALGLSDKDVYGNESCLPLSIFAS